MRVNQFCWNSLAVAFSVVLLAGGSAFANEAIQFLGANVISPTPVYDATALDWDVPDAELSAGTATNMTGSTVWFIAPSSAPTGVFNWNADLLSDENPGGPIADGIFAQGGTLRITGKVFNFFQELHDGLLLEATVSEFRMSESNSNLNQMNLAGLATITPTGGYLLTNTDGLNLVGDYFLDATIQDAQQNGGNVNDFSEDIVSVSSLQFNLVQVPEPATLVCFGFGLAVCLSRRRRTT